MPPSRCPIKVKAPADFVAWLDHQLSEFTDGAKMKVRWDDFYSTLLKPLPAAFNDDAMQVFFKHEKRLASTLAAPTSRGSGFAAAKSSPADT